MNLNFKNLLLSFIFVLFSHFYIYAQGSVRNLNIGTTTKTQNKKTISGKFHLKFYYNYFYEENETESYNANETHTYIRNKNNSDFGKLSGALIIEGRKFQHEIEIANLNIDKEDSNEFLFDNVTDSTTQSYSYILKRLNIHIKYKFIYPITIIKNRLKIITGVFVGPYINYERFIPKTNVSYPTKDRYIGAKLGFLSGINCNLTDRTYMSFYLPFVVSDFYWNRYKNTNPVLPPKLQDVKSFDNNFKPLDKIYQFQVGIGFKL